MPSGREWGPRSLSARLLWAWGLTAVVVGAALTAFLRADPAQWFDHSAMSLAVQLTDRVRFNAQGQPTGVEFPAEVQWLEAAAPLDLGYRIFDGRGDVLLWSTPQVRQAWHEAGLPVQTQPTHGRALVGGLPLWVRTVALDTPRGQLWLEVGLSERLISLLHAGSVNRVAGTILVTVTASILLMGLAQFLVIRRLMRPVRQLSHEASRIALNRPGHRLPVQGLPQELRPLVTAFNESLNRLEAAFARQLRFLADAAHELKTPLFLLRAQIELGDHAPNDLLRDVDHLSRQVQQLLMLAEVTEPRSYRNEPLNFNVLAAAVCRLLLPLAHRCGVDLRVTDQGAPVDLCGDRSAVHVLLKNLTENAIGFAPRGSAVTLTLTAEGLLVRDAGPGIDPAHLPRLFDRFWRAPDAAEGGAGLGLSICHEVALAHGWLLRARNVHPGAEFSLLFQPSHKPSPEP